MGSGSGIALKAVQWFVRGIQFCCCAIVLALYSYFLATMSNHNISIPNDIRAVEGISGIGVVYTIAGLVLLCCLAGLAFTSFVAIILDVAFIGGFVYIAWVNRAGASSCNGYVDTPYGRGQFNTRPVGSDGFTNLPSFRSACQMQTACLAVSIVAIFFFIFSIGMEIVLVRHRRKEARFGPSPQNNYTSGSARKGFFGRFRRNGTVKSQNANHLPQHTTPDQMRHSYNTETTAIGRDSTTLHKHGEPGLNRHQHDGQTAYPETGVATDYRSPTTPHHQYGDGVRDV